MAGSVQGISTYQTYLMVKKTSAGAYEKVIDITSFPDLIPPNDRIDITTLSDYMRKYIKGIGDTSEQTYGANYTPENYAAVNELADHQYDYALWFGASGSAGSEVPDGHNGKFEWTGDISAGINGGGVNEAVGMTVTCVPSTVINYVST
jgi:hypothetical protein